MASFFVGVNSVESLKGWYRRLAKEHHPDHGGDEDTMKALNAEYDAMLRSFDGSTSTGSDGKKHTYRYDAEVEHEVMRVIFNLLRLRMEGVEIALIGFWIWVRGNTKPYSEKLNRATGLGLHWHSERGCWYWKPEGWRSRKSSAGLDYLAHKYGYQSFENRDQEVDAAS